MTAGASASYQPSTLAPGQAHTSPIYLNSWSDLSWEQPDCKKGSRVIRLFTRLCRDTLSETLITSLNLMSLSAGTGVCVGGVSFFSDPRKMPHDLFS